MTSMKTWLSMLPLALITINACSRRPDSPATPPAREAAPKASEVPDATEQKFYGMRFEVSPAVAKFATDVTIEDKERWYFLPAGIIPDDHLGGLQITIGKVICSTAKDRVDTIASNIAKHAATDIRRGLFISGLANAPDSVAYRLGNPTVYVAFGPSPYDQKCAYMLIASQGVSASKVWEDLPHASATLHQLFASFAYVPEG